MTINFDDLCGSYYQVGSRWVGSFNPGLGARLWSLCSIILMCNSS